MLFKGKATWIEILDFCVFIEAICCQGNILHSFWNINLATPNPRARLVHYVAYVLTNKHATNAINEPNRPWTIQQLNKKLVHVYLFINKPSLNVSFKLV